MKVQKKTSQVIFALFGLKIVEASLKMLAKLTLSVHFINILHSFFVQKRVSVLNFFTKAIFLVEIFGGKILYENREGKRLMKLTPGLQ